MAIEDDNGEPCTAGNTEEGGPSRLLDPPVETAVASPPKTIAERLETVKAEEADLLRKFEKTHERYAKVKATRGLQMKSFMRKHHHGNYGDCRFQTFTLVLPTPRKYWPYFCNYFGCKVKLFRF